MALAVYNPFRAIESTLSRDPFFREFFRDLDRGSADVQVVFAPRMNVTELPDAFEILVETPGLGKDDINIEINEGRLVVWGEKKAEKEDRARKVHVREISYGAFRRELSLPDDVVQEKIQASYENGHLKLTLPRAAKRVSSRKVEIA